MLCKWVCVCVSGSFDMVARKKKDRKLRLQVCILVSARVCMENGAKLTFPLFFCGVCLFLSGYKQDLQQSHTAHRLFFQIPLTKCVYFFRCECESYTAGML